MLQAGYRTRNACPDVAIFLDAYTTLALRPFLFLTHTIYRILINQITKTNHRLACNFGSSIRAPSALVALLMVSFQRLVLLLRKPLLPQSLQRVTPSLTQRRQHNHCRRISNLRLLSLVEIILPRRTLKRITRTLHTVLRNLNRYTFEFVLNHLWNQRFAVR